MGKRKGAILTPDDALAPVITVAPPSEASTKSSQEVLGTLEKLPPELLKLVFALLDLEATINFRKINQRASYVIDHLTRYKALAKHAPNAIRGLLSTEAARWNSCENLYNAMRADKCSVCGNPAEYLYLLTCRRVCYNCLTTQASFLPLDYGQAVQSYVVTASILNELPHMKSLPSTSSLYSPSHRNPVYLFDLESVRDASIRLFGSVEALETWKAKHPGEDFRLRDTKNMPLKALFEGGRRITAKRTPRQSVDAIDKGVTNPYRFMVVVRAPSIDLAQ